MPRGRSTGTSYAPIQSDASAERLTNDDAPPCVNGLVTACSDVMGPACFTECYVIETGCAGDTVVVVVVAVVYLHDITTYINIREISQMNHANKDLKEVKNL